MATSAFQTLQHLQHSGLKPDILLFIYVMKFYFLLVIIYAPTTSKGISASSKPYFCKDDIML